MNIKDLIIRNNNSKSIKELQSWTVQWQTCTAHFGYIDTFNKVFISKTEAEEFIELLNEFRKITKSWIKISIKEN